MPSSSIPATRENDHCERFVRTAPRITIAVARRGSSASPPSLPPMWSRNLDAEQRLPRSQTDGVDPSAKRGKQPLRNAMKTSTSCGECESCAGRCSVFFSLCAAVASLASSGCALHAPRRTATVSRDSREVRDESAECLNVANIGAVRSCRLHKFRQLFFNARTRGIATSTFTIAARAMNGSHSEEP